ncbi:DNA-binding protein [Loktanella fryxellensis]|uniref:DNA-binding protein n=1 Tax=Loktanella fryxellensis TaxID=245187 RepID=A0A1H7YYU4_9RHOB|nr:HU family DNA-binding protein [Loktanella fryxellensis]SEM50538.1 DNA-binding protein [Loktanella fryxellensis]
MSGPILPKTTTDTPMPDTTGGTLRLTPITPQVETAVDAATPVAVAQPRVVGAAAAMPAGGEVKKAEFIDRVTARANLRKRDAKTAIEATLAELADILIAGGELTLPPMGKLKAIKVKDLGDGAQLLTIKLRTMKDGAGGTAPVAQGAEAGDNPAQGQGGKGRNAKGGGPKGRRASGGSSKNAKSGVADDDDEG